MSIREIEKGYYVEVFLGKDPMTGKKIRKTKTFSPLGRKSMKESKLWEAEMLESYKKGNLDVKGSMKLSDYLDYWFENYAVPNTAYHTQTRYKTFCECIKTNIGHIPLDELTPPLLERFYTSLRQETKTLKDGIVKRRYMDGTILKTQKVLHKALSKAVSWQYLSKNVSDYAEPPADDKRKISAWTVSEARQFMRLIREPKLWLAVFIAFYTGMREGEICALRWVDINFENDLISVNNNLVYRGAGITSLDDPKTDSSKADVFMPKELKKMLERIKKSQDAMHLASGRTVNFEYVCSWEDGRPLTPGYVARTFTKLVKKHNMKKITFHGLRHTHATILYASGASSNDISKRLRHSRVSTTDDIFIHITDEIKKSTADLFSRAVDNAETK